MEAQKFANNFFQMSLNHNENDHANLSDHNEWLLREFAKLMKKEAELKKREEEFNKQIQKHK